MWKVGSSFRWMNSADTAPRENLHHNMPTSRGGSDHDDNLSRVRVPRHDNFHDWAFNRTPCALTRLIAMHGIGQGEETIDPEVLNTIFQITTMSNWNRLYVAQTFHPVTLAASRKLAMKAAEYTRTHLLEEQLVLRNAIHAITNGGRINAQLSPFTSQALEFFKARNSAEAIHSMYTERYAEQLSWVKPMQEQTREDIVRTVRNGMVPYDQRHKSQLVRVLHKQQSYICRYLDEWDGACPRELRPHRKQQTGDCDRRKRNRRR